MAKLKEVIGNATPAEETVKAPPQNAKDLLKQQMAEETRLVKGRFRCFENEGSTETIIVRKYPGIEPFIRKMTDGHVYEIPLYVARHLQGYDSNAREAGYKINTCAYPIHGYKIGANEDPKVNMEEGISVPIIYKRRYGFESLEFEQVM